jgi:hypothetical protein
LVTGALWWENVGHFQINYRFNIDKNAGLGGALDGSSHIYGVQHSDLGHAAMKEAMRAWLEAHRLVLVAHAVGVLGAITAGRTFVLTARLSR